jgi:hypothetical protein
MQRPTKGTGPKPEVSPTRMFGKMIAAQKRGDFIRAGEAQQALERLGWTIRRKRPNKRRERAAAARIAAEAVAAGDGDESGSDSGQPMPEERLELLDVAWLVGATVEEVEKAVESGRFPRPDGYVLKKPNWDPTTLDRWVNRRGSL